MNAISKDQIAQLIPHQGQMNLIDEVRAYDAEHLSAISSCHQDNQHPLCNCGHWPSHLAIELAAQAMAIHGAMQAESARQAEANKAFVGALSKVVFHCDNLDADQPLIHISVCRETINNGSASYQFQVQYETTQQLITTGNALVLFSP